MTPDHFDYLFGVEFLDTAAFAMFELLHHLKNSSSQILGSIWYRQFFIVHALEFSRNGFDSHANVLYVLDIDID